MITVASLLDKVEIVDSHDDSIEVRVTWKGVDRTEGGGWSLPSSKRRLAERLARAVAAGDVHRDAHVAVDASGATYVASTNVVSGRRMSADLKRIGH